MKLSPAGVKHLRDFESLRLTAYPDPGSADGRPWTIGWGATTYEDGRAVQKGDVITRERADALLKFHMERAETRVLGMVTVPLTQGQFDALVSFEYNTGDLARSTLLKRLNAGDTAGAAEEFPRWKFNDGVVLPGLVNRRNAEVRLFTSQVATAGGPVPTATARDTGGRMDPFVLTALTALAQLVPAISKLFKGESPSRVAERNADAVAAIADKVLPIVIAAAGAPNAQAAVDAVRADPAVARAVETEVNLNYAELHELTERSLKVAREFNLEVAKLGIKPWDMPSFWISFALLIPLYYVIYRVMNFPVDTSRDLITQVVTGVMTVIGLVSMFWLGTSFGSQRKTELLAGEKQ